MDILIVAHFTQVTEKGNGRFEYIANMLSVEHDVELVTTTFSHKLKKHRSLKEIKYKNNEPYKITLIEEPGYNKNLSLKRVYSHYFFSINLKKYLHKRHKPDVIYCAVPSLDVGNVILNYAKKNNVKFIIDIQDLWPEAFNIAFNVPILKNIMFYPFYKKADKIYSNADAIVSVSETYKMRALKIRKNKDSVPALSVFLGTDLNDFDKFTEVPKLSKSNNELWLVYIGTLGHNYDLTTVIDSLRILSKEKSINNIKFIVIGDGPLRKKFEIYARKKQINFHFFGNLNYGKMVSILKMCDIAVNPITKGAAGSIINKVADYAAAALPVINTQESEEYRKLVIDYNIGFNCENGNAKDVAEKILKLYNNEVLRRQLGDNNRALAEAFFDRRKTYQKIINLITNI